MHPTESKLYHTRLYMEESADIGSLSEGLGQLIAKELNEIERLAEIGRATERLFEEWPYIESAYLDGEEDEYKSRTWEGLDELIGWYMGEEAEKLG